jgi:hypothetical protein
MTARRLRGKRTLLAFGIALVATTELSGMAGARVAHQSAAPNYSSKTGRVPSSERLHTTLHVSNDTTVDPAPKNTAARTSQRAALFAIGDFSPLRVDGRTFYPSVLFGLLTNSVAQPACDFPGLTIPTLPSTTPTTACHKGLFYQRVAVWAVIQHGACTPTTGPTPLPGDTTTTLSTTTTTFNPALCVLYSFVSAKTGKYLYGES